MPFYSGPPPPPSQGPVSSTPPIPHRPIPAQGDQPPRRQVAFALMMAAAVAAWPADQEPRLQAPNNTQQKIAPLTITYGQQPPRRSIATMMQLTAGAWPLDLEPRLGRPNEQQRKTAPLTLTYGSPPQPQGPITTIELAQLVASWPLDYPPIQGVRKSVAALPPPPVQYIGPGPTGQIYPAIFQATQELFELQVVTGFVIAPENPDRPPITGPPRTLYQLIASWQPPDPPPAQRTKSVLPVFPVAQAPIPQSPISTTELTQLVASWPLDLEPRLTRPNNQQQKIAPLTLPSGSQPLPQPPLSGPEFTAITANAPEAWGAQIAPKSAAWNVPPVVSYVPPTRFPDVITAANQVPDPPPLQRGESVVPIFPAASQPPIKGPHSPMLAIVASWADPPVTPRSLPSAAWIGTVIPPYLAPNRFPNAIYVANQPLDPQPVQRLQSMVPSFVVVSQPPIRWSQATLATVLSAWADVASAPQREPRTAWLTIPPIPPPLVPRSAFQSHILASWVETPLIRQRLAQIATTFALVNSYTVTPRLSASRDALVAPLGFSEDVFVPLT